MHLLRGILVGFWWFVFVNAYRHYLFTIPNLEEGKTREYKCAVYEVVKMIKEDQDSDKNSSRRTPSLQSQTTLGSSGTTATEIISDPYEVYQNYLHEFLYGDKIEMDDKTTFDQKLSWTNKNNSNIYRHYVFGNYMRQIGSFIAAERRNKHPNFHIFNISRIVGFDVKSSSLLVHSQSGSAVNPLIDIVWITIRPKNFMPTIERSMTMSNLSELFNNRSGVHLPLAEFLPRGNCELKITRDYMQTAVNAFAIFLYGTLDDIERLPADYVLRSTRTISMMKIAREKLAATWNVVKAGKETIDISHLTLEMYRPLFKYINGREMARLNLSDEKILTYIGTHADLDRHQVGVVTSKYIEINKDWSNPRYLNIMNNLLCGVPMTLMRKLPISTYLQLSHQVFYHIRACDPLQRRFYLAMMTRTKALGKSFSWTARDLSRLGLLLTEVEGTDLSAINPEAMAGMTAQVMMHMSPRNLQYLSENQLKYLAPKPLNILGRKLKIYNDQLQLYDSGFRSELGKLKCILLASSIIFLKYFVFD